MKNFPRKCHESFFVMLFKASSLNLFVPSATFLYTLESIRKLLVFLMFSGGRERAHWGEMV